MSSPRRLSGDAQHIAVQSVASACPFGYESHKIRSGPRARASFGTSRSSCALGVWKACIRSRSPLGRVARTISCRSRARVGLEARRRTHDVNAHVPAWRAAWQKRHANRCAWRYSDRTDRRARFRTTPRRIPWRVEGGALTSAAEARGLRGSRGPLGCETGGARLFRRRRREWVPGRVG